MRALPALASAGLALLLATPASAYCRTTTCDPKYEDCDYEGSCNISGKPLYWRNQCVGFGVQRDGSPLRGISAEQTRSVVVFGFRQWMGVDCGGAPPSISLGVYGQAIECGVPQYSQDAPNANVWMYRDDEWPYPQRPNEKTLALTTVTYNVETGEIFDVDVELNSAQTPLTIGDNNVVADLASIITHEAGHFLGLSHSSVDGATMVASYEFGTQTLRSLELDDIMGICEIYPPGRQAGPCNLEPRHGFSARCAPAQAADDGCGCRAPGGRSQRGAWSVLLLAFALLARRRQRA